MVIPLNMLEKELECFSLFLFPHLMYNLPVSLASKSQTT